MNICVYRGYRVSDSARSLTLALRELSDGSVLMNNRGEWFRSRTSEAMVINWGCVQMPQGVDLRQVLNTPGSVRIAGDKLQAFNALAEYSAINTPAWAIADGLEDVEDLRTCNAANGGNRLLLARSVLRGHSGEGISILRPGDEVPDDTKLLVGYIPKRDEYRVHVVNGRVIFGQKKLAKRDFRERSDYELKIRSHANGYVFAENFGTLPEAVTDQARAAVSALGLDFGAVDIVVSNVNGQPYVLEVNTAPGLQSTQLLRAYATAFNELALQRG